ncbi:hypothetical protein EMA8858_02983 [Emticicia aquatica]|uniref:Uncharacterized protein n=1 Tax=Emticicia aquatica TaxID=1681835 RepID=A0ABN8EYC3_9BACT|nr:hypothetical protein EMA8858_02983 [Emticicia aquatica]
MVSALFLLINHYSYTFEKNLLKLFLSYSYENVFISCFFPHPFGFY